MRFLQVGLGYRSQAFKSVVSDMADLECAGVVLRRHLAASVPTYINLTEALAKVKPDFVLSFTPSHSTPMVLRTCVEAGCPVLVETPPAGSVEDLDALADLVGSGLAFVAEQYPLMPGHAARLEAVRQGLIGEVSQVQISSTQTYHAMALIRAYLGIGIEPAEVRAATFTGPLVNPLTRAGWTMDMEPHEAKTVIASIDFGQGKSGVYDFTDNQTRNLLRTRRLLVRGSLGEISGEQVVRLSAPTLITTTYMERRQSGHDLDLNGYCSMEITLDGKALWTNPFPDQRWNDDEIAVGMVIRQMMDGVTGKGAGPYPLEQAIFDARLGLALDESVSRDVPIHVMTK